MDLHGQFDKVNDNRSFNLHKKIATLSQGTSISVYYSKVKDLWDESEALVPTFGCDYAKSKDFVVHMRHQNLYQFLMGFEWFLFSSS